MAAGLAKSVPGRGGPAGVVRDAAGWVRGRGPVCFSIRVIGCLACFKYCARLRTTRRITSKTLTKHPGRAFRSLVWFQVRLSLLQEMHPRPKDISPSWRQAQPMVDGPRVTSISVGLLSGLAEAGAQNVYKIFGWYNGLLFEMSETCMRKGVVNK